MNKCLVALLSLFISSIAYSQQQPAGSFYAPRKIEQTIGEKYILLKAPAGSKDYGVYLHLWPNPTGEIPVSSAEGGRTIVTLQSITPDSYARLTDEQGAIYYQYFKKDHDDEMMFFAPAADYEKAKSFINKQVWLKSDKKKVTIIDVKLTPDNNAPFKFTYKYANNKQGNIAAALSGTNSKKDKVQLFDDKFSFTAL